MYAPIDQIGQTIVCPDCETENRVVAPSPPLKRRTQPRVTGPLYDVRAPERVTRPKVEAQKMLEQATEDLLEQERKQPKAPRYPFLTGVLTFPFDLQIGGMCLALTVGMMAAIMMLLAVPRMSPFFIPIVCALDAIVAVAVLTAGSVTVLTIVEKTANCLDRIDEWPEFGLVDWMLQSFYLINSFVLSFVPVFLLVRRVGDDPVMAIASGAVLSFLGFPVILLSMLEESTPMMPFSRVVWRSLGRTWWAWGIFYLESLVLAGFNGLVAWGTEPVPLLWRLLIIVFVAVGSLTIYFRLLGRLAWVIGREGADPHHSSVSSIDVPPGGGVP
jgi:hypothetical protein